MLDFIGLLERFNRKERFFLVLQTLGEKQLRIAPSFRSELESKLEVQVPEKVFAATDYHLDWLAASVAAYTEALSEDQMLQKAFPNGVDNEDSKRVVTGSIQDIDLLVAFETKDGYHVVLIEAKGDQDWDLGQLNSKARRLKRIFHNSLEAAPKPIKRHFVLLAPKSTPAPSGSTDSWPDWMRKDGNPLTMTLNWPPERLKVVRTDEHGKPSSSAEMFKIVRV